MTDPDAVWLFLYSECGQQEKNSERTDLIVGLDRLTGLESILPHGLPMDVLKRRKSTLPSFFKRTLGGADSIGTQIF